MPFSENLINEIRERADIVDLIESFIPLKKAGRSFKALCPFHPEKTPSFYVNPDKQIFHCFGCGIGGNVFSFVMKYQNLEFPEAVRKVASIVGINLPEERKFSKEGEDLILKLNKAIMDYYHSLLLNSQEAKNCRDYLNKRGINLKIIELFKLGYAPDEWDRLVNYLLKRGWKKDFLISSGIASYSREGDRCYDMFRNRLIFPIMDNKQNTLGFGGRVLDESLPKYINSPETKIYKKGKTFYGINLSLDEIKKKRKAIIVEGYMDMISLYQFEIKNVVASLGTSLTEEQARFIKKWVDEVIVVYDSDQAGQIASLRGLNILFESGINSKAVSLPQGYDPDKFVREKGEKEFLKLLDKAQGIFSYKLNSLKKLYGIDDIDSRIKIAEEMLDTIEKINNYMIKAEYIKILAKNLGFEEQVLWSQMRIRKKSNIGSLIKNTSFHKSKYDPAEKTLILIMIEIPESIPKIMSHLELDNIPTSTVRGIISKILQAYPNLEKLKVANFLNYINDEEKEVLTEILTEEHELDRNILDTIIEDCIKKLKQLKLKKYREYLTQEIKKAQESNDENKVAELITKLNEALSLKST